MAITVASGFPVSNSGGSGLSTLSVTPATVGDIIVFSSKVSSTTLSITGISGGGCAVWNAISGPVVDATNGGTEELWYGIVTTTGATTITLTWSGTNSVDTDLVAFEFASGLTKTRWAIAAWGSQINTSSTTITWPSLKSNAASLQAYYGYARQGGTATAGSTTGFTYTVDSDSNIYCRNVALSANTSYQPTATTSPSSYSAAIAIIVSAVAFLPTQTIINQAVKRAAFR